ncbi:MAG: hypothetical protein H6Q06_2479, partial [Acidobacteria bacterium]|nr:hypothetical protein [Acidobacteriota bacterium]
HARRGCGAKLTVRKTRTRPVRTLHVGPFRAREVFLLCDCSGRFLTKFTG